MRFCIALAFNPPSQWVALARAAEAAGFAGLVVSDHLVYPKSLASAYPYTRDGQPRWSPETPWPDPLVAIGALGTATERLELITSIYILPLRHPVAAAKQVATAADFAGGRLRLGVGAGWMREEFDLLGQPFDARGRRLLEAAEVMRALWRGGPVAHRGEFFAFDAIQMSPPPAHPIPIWGGGTSPVALRRAAAHFDGWTGEIHTRAELRACVEQLRATRRDSPRAAEPFAICAAAKDAFRIEHYLELEEAGVTHLVTVPWLFYGATGAELGAKLDGIAHFADEVLRRLPASPPDARQPA